MSLAPSTYSYRAKAKSAEAVVMEARLVGRLHAVGAEFPRYGHRRVAERLAVPADLEEQVRARLAAEAKLAWDHAVAAVAQGERERDG